MRRSASFTPADATAAGDAGVAAPPYAGRHAMSDADAARPVPAERQRPLVLVADDEVDLVVLVEFHVKKLNCDVVTAKNGEEALTKATELLPDLCVLDVMMPRIDGYGVTRAIRQHPATERTPVLLLTARVQEADVAQGFEAGADDYLKKPFSPQELRARVQAVLGRR